MEEVKRLYKLGFTPIRCLNKSKICIIKNRNKLTREECLTTFNDRLDFNVGIITGKISNIIVLDIDIYKNEEKHEPTYLWVQKIFKLIKNHINVKTQSNNYHFYFKYDKRLKSKNYMYNSPYQIEIKSDKYYVIGPPSEGYKWNISPFTNELKEMPEIIVQELLLYSKKKEFDTNDEMNLSRLKCEFEEFMETHVKKLTDKQHIFIIDVIDKNFTKKS